MSQIVRDLESELAGVVHERASLKAKMEIETDEAWEALDARDDILASEQDRLETAIEEATEEDRAQGIRSDAYYDRADYARRVL